MIQTELRSECALIRLNRPDKRNAFNPELVSALHAAVQEFNNDDRVRTILFQGNGSAFSAGADLAYLQQLQKFSLEENETDSRSLAMLFEAIYHSPKRTVSWVNGYALAGGCGLASITDHCFASTPSHFGYTEVKIGFVPAIVMVYLRYKLPETQLNRLLLSGEIIDAKEAVRIGLIQGILEREEAVLEWIRDRTEQCSGQAIATTKALLREMRGTEHEEAIERAIRANAQARASQDCKRGIQAFLNKEGLSWA